jgi:hypothetical protein
MEEQAPQPLQALAQTLGLERLPRRMQTLLRLLEARLLASQTLLSLTAEQEPPPLPGRAQTLALQQAARTATLPR